jgi:tetratricopeptide (TPR) repeat protein
MRRVASALLALIAVSVAAAAPSRDAALSRARGDIAAGRYAMAESALAPLSRTLRGEERQEALFLLAGLERSAPAAQALLQRVIDEDPQGEWARRSYLELAKIPYALGRYDEAYRLLADARACDVSEEACLFQGLCAVMLERYADARRPLERIRRGKLRTWALLAMAEAEAGLGRRDEGCRRYQSLAGAMISPTALYRHAECLEDEGDLTGATREFREIVDAFRGTPEAVLAAEKLTRLARGEATPADKRATPATGGEAPGEEVLQSGYTIQFGSFRDRGNAIKLAAKIKRVYPGVRVDSELIRYREYHRVRFGYFETREGAQAKGEEISREMNEDFTVMPLP